MANSFLPEHGSLWANLLEKCVPLNTRDRALALEASEELASAHKTAALQGDTEAPQDPEDEVDYHYICFVPSQDDSYIYELDGDCKGPIKTNIKLDTGEDMLVDKALNLVRAYIDRENGLNVGFNLMALVQT
jgi:ubiquitin carboxyl-terminal hydrolase L3